MKGTRTSIKVSFYFISLDIRKENRKYKSKLVESRQTRIYMYIYTIKTNITSESIYLIFLDNNYAFFVYYSIFLDYCLMQ